MQRVLVWIQAIVARCVRSRTCVVQTFKQFKRKKPSVKDNVLYILKSWNKQKIIILVLQEKKNLPLHLIKYWLRTHGQLCIFILEQMALFAQEAHTSLRQEMNNITAFISSLQHYLPLCASISCVGGPRWVSSVQWITEIHLDTESCPIIRSQDGRLSFHSHKRQLLWAGR